MSKRKVHDGDLEVTGLLIGAGAGGFPVTGIDFTATGTTDILTVEAGQFFIPQTLVEISESVITPGNVAEYKLKTDLPRDLTNTLVSQANASNKYTYFEITDDTLILSPRKVQFEILTASTAATHTGRIILIGILGEL